MATEPRLAILGTGRSGSGYISAVLNAAGVPCGHEGWWNPLGQRADGLAADSSWCALVDLDAHEGAVGFQTRHPLATVASLAQLPDEGPYRALRERLLGPLPDDPSVAAVVVALGWGERCDARASLRWRVEAVDADLVQCLASLAGVTISDRAATAAVHATPGTVNSHDTVLSFGWADLPDHPASVALEAQARRFGY